jgi:hypothetical protein
VKFVAKLLPMYSWARVPPYTTSTLSVKNQKKKVPIIIIYLFF